MLFGADTSPSYDSTAVSIGYLSIVTPILRSEREDQSSSQSDDNIYTVDSSNGWGSGSLILVSGVPRLFFYVVQCPRVIMYRQDHCPTTQNTLRRARLRRVKFMRILCHFRFFAGINYCHQGAGKTAVMRASRHHRCLPIRIVGPFVIRTWGKWNLVDGFLHSRSVTVGLNRVTRAPRRPINGAQNTSKSRDSFSDT